MYTNDSSTAVRRLELIGPKDYIGELRAALEAAVQPDFHLSASRQPGIGGTDALKLVLDITEVSVQLVSIYLAGHHIARESIRIKKDGKTIDVAKADEAEAIAEKIKE